MTTASLIGKARESAELIASTIEACAPRLEVAARALADRFRRGGRLFAMGNGGSACDALHAAVEFQHPIVEKRRPLPASALPADVALLTAVGNDGDFGQVFAAQLALACRDTDAALGISTSGTAANVLRAMRTARELGACTVGFTGRDGGPLADMCEHAFVVPSWSIHRIQEVHTVLLHLLWDHVHVELGAPDVL
ncbi:MAG: SIS domain-containing protein [Deltaproteobacteria bacterium]|nr:SIS domain-containing protein [Deltaproteobacteria bacterium]